MCFYIYYTSLHLHEVYVFFLGLPINSFLKSISRYAIFLLVIGSRPWHGSITHLDSKMLATIVRPFRVVLTQLWANFNYFHINNNFVASEVQICYFSCIHTFRKISIHVYIVVNNNIYMGCLAPFFRLLIVLLFYVVYFYGWLNVVLRFKVSNKQCRKCLC